MSRLIFRSQDLRGQILDASKQQDGHARQSLIENCQTDINTRFVGDWRGSDFLNNTGPADWSKAQTYACYWRGNKNLSGSLWPADIGFLHHQPVATIIEDRLTLAPNSVKPRIQSIATATLTSDPMVSWDTTGKELLWDGMIKTQRQEIGDAFRAIVAPYPGLTERFERLAKNLETGGSLWGGTVPTSVTLTWPDGPSVVLNALNLPSLPDPSRYTLARWVEAQADAQAPDPHFCYVFSTLPMRARATGGTDAWISIVISGY